MKKILSNLHKQAFRSIFLSYFILCILALVIAGAGYIGSYRTLRETTAKYGEQQAYTVAEQVNSRLTSLMKTLDVLAGKTILSEFGKYTDREISTNATRMLILQEEFSIAPLTDTCSELLIWFEKSQSITRANAHRYNNSLMPLFYKAYGLTAGEFEEAIHYKTMWNNYITADGKVWIMRSVYDDKYNRTAILIAVLDFHKILAPMRYADSGSLLLLSSGETLLYCSEELPDDAADGALHSTPPFFEIGGTKYITAVHTLPSLDIACTVGIPEKVLYSGIHVFWYTVVLELLGAVVLMLFLSIQQAKRTYSPIEQLISILHVREDQSFRKTYDSLICRLQQLKEEHTSLSKEARQNQMQQNLDKITYILNGSIDDPALIEPVMREWAGIASGEPFVMALVCLPDKADELFRFNQYREDSADLKNFVLKNVLDELLFLDYPGNLALVEGQYILFIKAGPDALDTVAGRLERMRQFYQDAFALDTMVVLGRCPCEFTDIAAEFRLLWDELRYAAFWSEETMSSSVLRIWEDELTDKPVNLRASLEANRQLLNCLEAGDYKAAYEALDYIVQKTVPKNRQYLDYSIYRMYGLISTLSQILYMRSGDGDGSFWDENNYEERLYNVKTVHQLMTVSKDLFHTIIDYNAGKLKTGVPGWLCSVESYISDNYSDVNLSVAAIAEHFHLSVPHLSRTFKNAMGLGLLEYIQKRRVAKARELLDLGISVTEAAGQVGYADPKTLRRAFKRYEGINPGEYRRNICKEKEEGGA